MKKTLLFLLLLSLSCLSHAQGAYFGTGSASITHIADASGCENTGGAPCVNGTGTVSTSSGLNILVGDKYVGFCKSGGANNTFTVTDTAGNTPTMQTHENDGNVGNTQMFYGIATVANAADIFTCANSNSANFAVVIVKQYRGGLASSIADVSAVGLPGGITMTSSSFTTAVANEVVVLCAGQTGANTISVGTIGGVTATNFLADAGNSAACEDLIETTTQSSITATMVGNISANWNYGLGAFK